MSKIILGIKDGYRPMRILGFDGKYSIETGCDLAAFDFRKSKITLETNGAITEFDCTKDALNYIYVGGGRSEELTALSILEKSLATKKDNFKIAKVIYSNPATIIFWKDGSKTVVKCQEDDNYSYAEGIMHAIIRKIFGDDNKQYSDILKWISTAEEYDKACEAAFKEESK